jgi:hypothetical protein
MPYRNGLQSSLTVTTGRLLKYWASALTGRSVTSPESTLIVLE